MSMEIKQHLKLSQQLVMTPQLQQAIKLLQLSRVELVDMVREELLENPVLEDSVEVSAEQAKPGTTDGQGEAGREAETERIGETETPVAQVSEREGGDHDRGEGRQPVGRGGGGLRLGHLPGNPVECGPHAVAFGSNSDELPSIEATLTRGTSLFDHLEWQLKLTRGFSKEEEARRLAHHRQPDPGRVPGRAPGGAGRGGVGRRWSSSRRSCVRVQEFDPPGVAARNLQECLLLQARHVGADDDLVIGIITKHLHNLEKRNYAAIAKDLNQPLEEVYEATKVVLAFDPKPGRAYTDEEPNYITPDVYIQKVGDKYFVVANDDGLPKLKISDFYRVALGKGPKAREYIQERLRSAQWLIRSIQQRQRTIVRVTESILRFQREFFEKGSAYLKPLILRDVADDIGMHESTVSRVTTNKYVHTPQGIFELKYFFNSGITRSDGDDLASEAVKLKIKKIIDGEDASTRTRTRRSSSSCASRTSRSPAAPWPSTASSCGFSPAASASKCSSKPRPT